MGGIAGHMNHVYDNLNLTFSGLLDIFTQAAAGALRPTEKVDGQNLYFTYDLRDDKVKFARRPDEAASGGITKESLNAEFVRKRDASANPEGYQNVVDAFYLGMTAIELALNSVSNDVLVSLFERAKLADVGDETAFDTPTVFINCEIMYSENRNMIMYDGDFIVFHKFDLLNENLESLSEDELLQLDSSMREKFNALVAEVEKSEQVVGERKWKVVGPQVRELNNLDVSFLEEAREKIETIIRRYNLTLDDKFSDYLARGIEEYIQQAGFTVTVPQDVVTILQRAVIDPKGFAENPGSIGGNLQLPSGPGKSALRKKIINNYMGGSKQDAALLSNFLSKTKSFALMTAILEPFAQITPGLTASLMRGVPSAFMTDSDKGTEIFRRTVELAIQYLENMFKNADPTDEKINSLKKRYDKQMARLQSVDNISSAMEGVVFEYPPMSNQFYKFTGGFAAANQILGYLGWDVKDKLTKQAMSEINLDISDMSEGNIRKLVRGSIISMKKGQLKKLIEELIISF